MAASGCHSGLLGLCSALVCCCEMPTPIATIERVEPLTIAQQKHIFAFLVHGMENVADPHSLLWA